MIEYSIENYGRQNAGCDGNYMYQPFRHLEETKNKTVKFSIKECQSATFLPWKAAHVRFIYGNLLNGEYRVGGKNDLPSPFLDSI